MSDAHPMDKVVIKKRVAYGNVLYDPYNDTARAFADLLGVKTLTKSQLTQIRDSLGYSIELAQDQNEFAS